MISLNDMRKLYLDFFAARGHEIVPSSPLVPENDPTLLFTNSGMVQFKDVLMGKETRPYVRAASVQKSIRINGKHDDLDNVGYDGRHHSFFEMLGNWSFGDYFKEESIAFSWEFLTKTLKLPKERLWFTTHPSDSESRALWKKIAGVSDERVIDVEDNVWAAGDVGPCGSDTEIFYDQGEDVPGGLPGTPDEDGDRYLEIWNNVFMEFETLPSGNKIPLKNKNVDTGMGLERISSVVQGVNNNFDIDLFKNIIADIEEVLHMRADKANVQPFRVIADHVRAVSFLIADGVVPSNEGRGYVLRRIIRRALRHINLLGVKKPAMFEMAASVRREMGAVYGELNDRHALIRETIRGEEEGFLATLEGGLKILEDEIAKTNGKTFPGESAFRLYDTYGFPLDLTQDILRRRGISVDEAAFDRAMKEQREKSRAASNFKGEAGVAKAWADAVKGVAASEFVGYEALEARARVVAKRVIDGTQWVAFDRTPFYAESGGQVADKGTINGSPVEDVRKVNGVILHRTDAKVEEGAEAALAVDRRAREDTMHNHSAAHLLQAALRQTVGEHIAQRGSWVGADSFHFDFTHPRAVSAEELIKIELAVNENIERAMPISVAEMPIADAKKTGAIALFGEKYGERVRVVDMGGRSIELCGGTHCKNTQEIGLFKITREESIAAGIRRISAITGRAAGEFAAKHGVKISTPVKTIAALQAALEAEAAAQEAAGAKEREEKKAAAEREFAADMKLAREHAASEKANGCVFTYSVCDIDAKNLKDAAREITGPNSVVIVIATKGGKPSVVVAQNTGRHDAVALVKLASLKLGGAGGGGRPDMAQAGGRDLAMTADAVAAVRDAL